MRRLMLAGLLVLSVAAPSLAADTSVTGFLTADSGVIACDSVTRYYSSQNLGPDKTIRLAQHNESGTGVVVSQSWVQSGSTILSYLVSQPSGVYSGVTALHPDPARSWPYGASVILQVTCYGGGSTRSQVYVWVDNSGI